MVAVLGLLTTIAGAVAAEPGMADLDVKVRTPLRDVDPAPVPVQNPVFGNVVPDLVDKVAPLLAPTGTDVGNTPTGQRVQPPLGLPPLQIDEWGYVPGIGPHSFEPLRTLVHLVETADHSLPVDLVHVDVGVSENGVKRTSFGVDPDGLPARERASDEGDGLPLVRSALGEADTTRAMSGGLARPGLVLVAPAVRSGIVSGGPPGATEWEAAAPPGWPIAVLLLGAGFGLLAVPLYRRLAERHLVGDAVRQAILRRLAQNPGLHQNALARELALGRTLVQYHVRLLVEFGFVEVHRSGSRACLFLRGTALPDQKARAAAHQGRRRDLVARIAAHPGIAQRELARAVGLRESTVKWHLDVLVAAGLVEAVRVGPRKCLRLRAALA